MSGPVVTKDFAGIITKKEFVKYPSGKRKLLWKLQTDEGKEELIESWNEEADKYAEMPEKAEVVVTKAEYRYSNYNKKLTAYIEKGAFVSLGQPDPRIAKLEGQLSSEGFHPDVQAILDFLRTKWGETSIDEINKAFPTQPGIVVDSSLHILLDKRKIHEVSPGIFIALTKSPLDKPATEPAQSVQPVSNPIKTPSKSKTKAKAQSQSGVVTFEEQGEKVVINPDDYLEKQTNPSAITIATNKTDKEIKIEITIKIQ